MTPGEIADVVFTVSVFGLVVFASWITIKGLMSNTRSTRDLADLLLAVRAMRASPSPSNRERQLTAFLDHIDWGYLHVQMDELTAAANMAPDPGGQVLRDLVCLLHGLQDLAIDEWKAPRDGMTSNYKSDEDDKDLLTKIDDLSRDLDKSRRLVDQRYPERRR